MHLKRWITSLVVLPLLFFLIYKGGGILFSIVVCAVCLVSLWEYYRIVTVNDEPSWTANPLVLLSFITGAVIIWAAYHQSPMAIVCVTAVNLILSALLTLPLYQSRPSIVHTVYKQSLGIVYIPMLLSHLVFIRQHPSGMIHIFWLLSVVFAGDIGAYYAGTYFGRHKLCPSVSPGKTWEGSIGGLTANICTGALFKCLLLPEWPWGSSLFLSAVAGIAGQVGDLFESELKRTAKVKDSGIIFPGHGGMLDRIDALLFASPAAYYCMTWVLTP